MIKDHQLITEYFNKHYPTKKKYAYNEFIGGLDPLSIAVGGGVISIFMFLLMMFLNRSKVVTASVGQTFSNEGNYKTFSNGLQRTRDLIQSSSMTNEEQQNTLRNFDDNIIGSSQQLRNIYTERGKNLVSLLGSLRTEIKDFPNDQQGNVNKLINSLKESEAKTISVSDLKEIRQIVKKSDLKDKDKIIKLIDDMLKSIDTEKGILAKFWDSTKSFFGFNKDKKSKKLLEEIINSSKLFDPPISIADSEKRADETFKSDKIYFKAEIEIKENTIEIIKTEIAEKAIEANIIITKDGLLIIDDTTFYSSPLKKEDALSKILEDKKIFFENNNIYNIKKEETEIPVKLEGFSNEQNQKVKISYDLSGKNKIFFNKEISENPKYYIKNDDEVNKPFEIKDFSDEDYINLIKTGEPIEIEIVQVDISGEDEEGSDSKGSDSKGSDSEASGEITKKIAERDLKKDNIMKKFSEYIQYLNKIFYLLKVDSSSIDKFDLKKGNIFFEEKIKPLQEKIQKINKIHGEMSSDIKRQPDDDFNQKYDQAQQILSEIEKEIEKIEEEKGNGFPSLKEEKAESKDNKKELKDKIIEKIKNPSLRIEGIDDFIINDFIDISKVISDNLLTEEEIRKLIDEIQEDAIKKINQTSDNIFDEDEEVDFDSLPEDDSDSQALSEYEEIDSLLSEIDDNSKLSIKDSYSYKNKKSDLIFNEIFSKEIKSLINKKVFNYFEDVNQYINYYKGSGIIIYKIPSKIKINDIKKIKYSNIFIIDLSNNEREIRQVNSKEIEGGIKKIFDKDCILFYQNKEKENTNEYQGTLILKNFSKIEKYKEIINKYFDFDNEKLKNYLYKEEKEYPNAIASENAKVKIFYDFLEDSKIEIEIIEKGKISSDKAIKKLEKEKPENLEKIISDLKNSIETQNQDKNVTKEIKRESPSPEKELNINIFTFFREFKIKKSDKTELQFVEKDSDNKLLIFNFSGDRLKQIYNSNEYKEFKQEIEKRTDNQPVIFQYNENKDNKEYSPVNFEIKVSFFTNQSGQKVFSINKEEIKKIIDNIEKAVSKKETSTEVIKTPENYYFLSLDNIVKDSSELININDNFDSNQNGIIFKKFKDGKDIYSGNLYVKDTNTIKLKELQKLQKYFNIDMQDYILQEAFDIKNYESFFISDDKLSVQISDDKLGPIKRKGNIKQEKNNELISKNKENLKSEIENEMKGIDKDDPDYQGLYNTAKEDIYKKYNLIDLKSETGKKISSEKGSIDNVEVSGFIYKKVESKKGITLIKKIDKIKLIKDNENLELYYYIKIKDSFYYFPVNENISNVLNSIIKTKNILSNPSKLSSKIDDQIESIKSDFTLLKKIFKLDNSDLKKDSFRFGRIAKVETIKDRLVFNFPTSDSYKPSDVEKTNEEKKESSEESFNFDKIDSIIISEMFKNWKK